MPEPQITLTIHVNTDAETFRHVLDAAANHGLCPESSVEIIHASKMPSNVLIDGQTMPLDQFVEGAPDDEADGNFARAAQLKDEEDSA